MKKRTVTRRIFLYTVLAGALLATWIAACALFVPDTEPSSGDLLAFERNVRDLSTGILESRRRAIESAGGVESIDINETVIGAVPGISVRRSPGRQLTYDDFLSTEIPGTSAGTSGTGLARSDELDRTLDLADALYEERIAEQVDAQEPMLRDSMIALRSDSVMWFGYRGLHSAINRDLLKYRTLDSLQLHEIKLDLYSTAIEAIRVKRKLARDATRTEAVNIESQVRAGYDEELAAIIDEVIAELIENGSIEGTATRFETLERIITDLDNLSGAPSNGQWRIEHGYPPDLGQMQWLNDEIALTDTYENAIQPQNGN